ncbi:hypothetical protein PG984_014084 [Apiospora sp. TS-2023a]
MEDQHHKYPGLGLDLRHYASGGWPNRLPCYPIGHCANLHGATSDLIQVREVFMMAIMDRLTDKPDWDKKVFDEEIVAKWRAEALQMPEEGIYRMVTEHVEPKLYGEDSKIALPERARYLSGEAFDYCIKELRSKARHFQKTGLIPALDAVGNSVAKSDVLVGPELKSELVAAFDRLRADQAADVDWQPRSNDMVQNLVHPSMYPLVWGQSSFLQDEVVGTTDAVAKWAGKGETTPSQGENYWSANYQWLPANLEFRYDDTVRFTSYINNLHPTKYEGIYRTIEKLVERALPAWEQCIADCQPDREGGDKVVGRKEARISPAKEAHDEETDGLWEELDREVLAEHDVELEPDILEDLLEYAEMDASSTEEDDDSDLENDVDGRSKEKRARLVTIHKDALDEAKWKMIREPVFLEPDPFKDVDYAVAAGETLREKFLDSGLQVIVKMASIELTPEKPEFATGSWHVEGQMNEHICATALYYLDSENVTPSSLAFRMGTSWDQMDLQMSAGQDAYNWLERSYGTSFGPSGGGGPCVQYYGSVDTPEGRLLAFPNVLVTCLPMCLLSQHRVSSFRLQDPTKPGHRRFLALWLVDPHQRIVSTANIPPQQLDWWADAVFKNDDPANPSSVGDMSPEVLAFLQEKDGLSEKLPPSAKTTTVSHSLPPEIVDMVRKEGIVPAGLMSREEARAHRLKLMDERSQHDKTAEDMWYQGDYNFCEH